MSGSQINIVHLSDLHLSERREHETNNIIRTLLSDIKNRVQSESMNNLYIAITGDLTYSGKKEEFEIVRDFIKTLDERLSPEKILLVPGNHDLDWGSHATSNRDLMEDLIQRGEEGIKRVEDRFHKTSDLKELMVGMQNYYDFIRSIGQDFSNFPYSLYGFNMEKFKINFIGLNSAYLFSKKYPYYGYIGLTQIDDATNLADDVGALDQDFRIFNITMFHHPFEAIIPAAQQVTETMIKSRSDLILTGHVHSLRAYVDITASLVGERNTRGHPLISSARCVYDEVNDPHIVPGYAIIGIPFDYDTVKPLKIWEMIYDKSKIAWYRDPNNPIFPYLLDTGFGPSFPSITSELPVLRVGDLKEVLSWGWDAEKLVNTLESIDYEVIEGLKEEDEGPTSIWKNIRSEHPDTWRVIYTSKGEIAGYWSFVPLFSTDYDDLMSGKFLEGDIREEMIPVMEVPGHYDIFFTCLALRLKYRGTSAVHILYRSFLDVVQNLATNGIFIDRIGTNAYTPAGVAVSKSFDLQYVRDSPSHGKLYQRKFFPFPNTQIFKENITLSELYQNEYSKKY